MADGADAGATEYVADTSVFVLWYVQQPGAEHARSVRQGVRERRVVLHTSGLMLVELLEVLRKQHGALPADTLRLVLAMPRVLGLQVHPLDDDALRRAVELATRHSLRIFDALFVDVALATGLPLLTADRALVRAIGGRVSTEVLRGVGRRPG